MSDASYKSTGTVRVRIEESGSPSKVFFTPNDDSTVRRGDKEYAVFSPAGEGDVWLRSKPLSKSGEGIPINVATNFPGLIEAAVQQTLVEVEVTEPTLTLRAITIPAPGKQK